MKVKVAQSCLTLCDRMDYAAAAAAKSLQLCPTVRPQRRQPTRLPRPWDCPGKNSAVGCHFLLTYMYTHTQILLRRGENLYLQTWVLCGKVLSVLRTCFLSQSA